MQIPSFSHLEEILLEMEPITLEEMSGVKLMNRIDTKFLTSREKLVRLLRNASENFMIQDSENIRNSAYYTCYFDTKDVKMYYNHQRGKKSRRKVRIRQYLNSEVLPFLEIKDKNNKGRTKKKRVSMQEGTGITDYEDFINRNSEFSSRELLPKIENRFNRITLVNKEKSERITIDTSLEFHNFATLIDIKLPELVIIEWKRDALSSQSHLKPLLRQLKIQESGFSKYVIGMALTDCTLPQNRLKKKIRLIENLINGRI